MISISEGVTSLARIASVGVLVLSSCLLGHIANLNYSIIRKEVETNTTQAVTRLQLDKFIGGVSFGLFYLFGFFKFSLFSNSKFMNFQ